MSQLEIPEENKQLSLALFEEAAKLGYECKPGATNHYYVASEFIGNYTYKITDSHLVNVYNASGIKLTGPTFGFIYRWLHKNDNNVEERLKKYREKHSRFLKQKVRKLQVPKKKL